MLVYGHCRGNKNKAMTNRIMSADKSRLNSKMTDLPDVDMASIEVAMKRFFSLA